MNKHFKTIDEFLSHFKDEETCRIYFERIRFANGDYCPHCKHDSIMRFKDGKRYRCRSCKKDFSIKTGTIFGESNIPLKKWFIAVYLLTSRKKGISSIELSKSIGVSQKTAWFMDHRLREALKQGTGKLFGTIEVDETYVGGKQKNKHWNKRIKHTQGRSTLTKTAVMGLFQRGGEVRARVVPNVKMSTVENHIIAGVEKGSQVYTDKFFSYSKLDQHFEHEVVDHGKYEYVRGDVHSNTAESFWALFKRTYHGTYHIMSPKHMQRYVDESVFRHNNRNVPVDILFETFIGRSGGCARISYKALSYGYQNEQKA